MIHKIFKTMIALMALMTIGYEAHAMRPARPRAQGAPPQPVKQQSSEGAGLRVSGSGKGKEETAPTSPAASPKAQKKGAAPQLAAQRKGTAPQAAAKGKAAADIHNTRFATQDLFGTGKAAFIAWVNAVKAEFKRIPAQKPNDPTLVNVMNNLTNQLNQLQQIVNAGKADTQAQDILGDLEKNAANLEKMMAGALYVQNLKHPAYVTVSSVAKSTKVITNKISNDLAHAGR